MTRFRNFLFYLKILLVRKKIVTRNITNWDYSLKEPTQYYLDAFRFYYLCLPRQLTSHKNYFSKSSRGFGEKAFHSMWYLLYNRYHFQNFVEIGVYRGQTISLVSLISKLSNSTLEVHGISPFSNAGDASSTYIEMDYLNDVYKNFETFSLKTPSLTKAYSTDKKATDVLTSRIWDCIYIDGSHDYEIAKTDWEVCSRQIKVGGIIVLDDSALYTNFTPPFFAFKGHEGPSKVAAEISDFSFKEVLQVGHNRVFEKIN